MTLEEYFGQGEYYFSESQQEMVPLEVLPFPRLFYSCRKLLKEHGDEFMGTRLWEAFAQRLSPSPEMIRSQLRKYGSASCIYFGDDQNAVRSKLYGAAKRQGLKVTTHKDKYWITATAVAQASVKVKGRQVA